MSVEFWIWLQRTLGFQADIAEIIAYFGSPEGLYMASDIDRRISGVLTASQLNKLSRFKPSESAKIMNDCKKNSWQIVTPSDTFYPERLRKIKNFPAVLYVWGDAGVLNSPVQISVVGTRRATPYGQAVARDFSKALAQGGAVVVSGGAMGIDSCAHEGTISGGGKTIAVLGCGLGTDYLMSNEGLRKNIANSGAVISEFEPFHAPGRTTFPIRNRIISGLGLGTLVIEAGEHSGSLITARLAAEQGRDVFAVPGDVISSTYKGAHKLIRDGAQAVFSAVDILREYEYYYPGIINIAAAQIQTDSSCISEMNKDSFKKHNEIKKESSRKEKRALSGGFSESSRRIYDVLTGCPQHIDELAAVVGLSLPEVNLALTELEIEGYAVQQSGRRYIFV